MTRDRDLYFSFFMFTADLRPDDQAYTQTMVAHMCELVSLGYAGFDLPIAPSEGGDHAAAIKSYERFGRVLGAASLNAMRFTTNVAATRRYDPTSPDPGIRAAALAYLKSRVDITAVLGGDIMAGPIVFPYGAFPRDDRGQTIWSDALQRWVVDRYALAAPVLQELGAYAQTRGVKLAIEPVDHWETAAPNLVSDVLAFLDQVDSRQVGVCIDSAHVALGSDGPAAFAHQVGRLAAAKRLHYVHISAPDRGAVRDSWIDWSRFFAPISVSYDGPLLVEVFNAIPAFLDGLRLTRRKFWIPGEDPAEPGRPSAYAIARDAIACVRHEIDKANPR